ncbi:MAG: hypothetical protein QGH15_04885 [Kiritimatiellia bacterium]|nr:hypothetical protein [Kiritimatiellia bacterium]
MRCLSISVLFALLVLSAPVAHARGDGPSLVALRSVYDEQKRMFDKPLEEKRAEASERYLADLQSLVRYMEQKGDDFGVRPVNKEIVRFKAEKTVPEESAAGTPELLKKARARYYEIVDKAKADRNGQLKTLTQKYVSRLKAQRSRLLSNSSPAEATLFAEEIARVSSEGGDSISSAKSEIRLPQNLSRDLRLAYTFEGISGRRVRDLSGWRRHGAMMGVKTRTDPAEGVVCEFKGQYDAIEPEQVGEDAAITISARVQFPLAQSEQARVLASGGFGKDHVVVDERGILGTGAGGFTPSKFSVGNLKGWHDLTFVCGRTRTAFYVDGKAVGVVEAACREPLKVVGNSGAGGRPWCGSVSSLMAWSRSLSSAEVEALIKVLRQGK